jgi:hypothetical protein
MAKIVFTNPKVGDRYETDLEKDITVHAKGYSGKLSGINETGADHLVKSNTGYLKEKKAPGVKDKNVPGNT